MYLPGEGPAEAGVYNVGSGADLPLAETLSHPACHTHGCNQGKRGFDSPSDPTGAEPLATAG